MRTKLKSLELQGYKTFASKSVFEFPGAITAIVGPNGSGKSNIADALRWVLGEQSYSMLRGRKTEDMIFAGSEHRARGSMASVNVVFDNDDGWLPVDYNEVSLTRKAYRDGQNEYYLNGQRVRLRETAELLSQSGLAERTYTIIGQGLVDAALALKPEERRKFFEEAAGIGLYRSRRDEAINRLETTKRNLTRVNDILSELEPRLKSLERHASKANEYERVKADLEVLLKDWYGFHWSQFQSEVSKAREIYRTLESQLNFSKERFSETESKTNLQRQQLADLRAKLGDLHKQSGELHATSERISRELAVLSERQASSEQQRINSDSDLARIGEERKVLLEREASIKSEVEATTRELSEAEKSLKDAENASNLRSVERNKLEQRLQSARRKMMSLQTTHVQVNAHFKEVQSRVASIKNSLAAIDKEGESQSQTTIESKKALDQFSQLRRDVGEKLETLQNSIKVARQKVNELEQTKRDQVSAWNAQNSERIRLQSQLKALEESESNLAGVGQGLKSMLDFVSGKKGMGAARRLSQALEVPEQYEAAISAALGNKVEALIVDSKKDATEVIEFLKSGASGRGSLLISDHNNKSPKPSQPKIEGVLGVAADFVKADADKKAIESLLGSTYVVTDHSVAIKLLSELKPGERIVTLAGEVFSAGGLVEAGKLNPSAALTRPREIQELRKLLVEAEYQLNRGQSEINQIDEAVNAKVAETTSLEQELLVQQQSANQNEREYQKLSLAFEQANQKSQWQKSQILNLGRQLEQAEGEILSDKSRLDKLNEEIKVVETELTQSQEQFDKLPIHELQSNVIHWRTQQTLLSRGLHEANRRLDDVRLLRRQNDNQSKIVTSRLNFVAETVGSLEGNKQRLKEEEREVQSNLLKLQEIILSEENLKASLESSYENAQQAFLDSQVQVSQHERRSIQAHFDVQRLEESMENLRKQIEEDFGLVELSYEDDNTGPKPLPFEGLVSQFPKLTELPEDLDEVISRKRGQLKRIGPINPEAQTEFASVKERYEFLTTQVGDLGEASADLQKVITELDDLMRTEFKQTFDAAAAEFSVLFTRVFGGGSAKLVLQDEENPTEGGIDIEARLPGRREQGLSLLSGGERSLTAVALIFALLKVSPTPFCVLDEVDAMLDEANVGRFGELLKELSDKTQFILITHNRNTVQIADVIYGITMSKDSTSQVISLRLDEVSDEMVR